MMQHVNRRRLLIVVLIALLFGLALPRLEDVISGGSATRDYVSMDPPLNLSEANIQEIGRRSFGLISLEWIAANRPFHQIVVERTGWPFRATYTWTWTDTNGTPRLGETGILWWGAIGDLLSFVLVAGGLYCAVAYAWSRWSIWRRSKMQGICKHCGYEVRDMPVCPECGTTT